MSLSIRQRRLFPRKKLKLYGSRRTIALRMFRLREVIMVRRVLTFIGLLTIVVGTATAQDAMTLLRATSAAMGVDEVQAIRYSGTGWLATVGQGYIPDEDWPRSDLTYTRTIDYETRASGEQFTRRQGEYPPRGGGGVPVVGDWDQEFYVSGEYVWNVLRGAEPGLTSRLATSNTGIPPEERKLDIWLSPHGVIKAALASDDATATPMVLEGEPKMIVSFTAMDRFRVNVTITADNMVERVQTWVPNAVFGDMVHEHRYTDYQNYDGVMFPSLLHSHRGDPRLNPGHNWIEVRVDRLTLNPPDAAITVPDNIRTAVEPAAVTIESQQLAEGVWRIAGQGHHSFAVEFSDFIAVVEAPQDELRSLGVIREIERLIPNKPIQYVVNTHYHFDHSGGLRTYVARGTTVVTHAGNLDFYQNVFFYPSPRTLEPDLLSTLYPWFRGNRIPTMEGVTRKYVISDGRRTLDVYALQGINHDGNMIVAYLPTEKILINADLYSPPANPGQIPAANHNIRALNENIQRLNLDLETHAGVHGLVGSHEVFLEAVDN